jgi:formamidopyrimidine-DNA glycosylase
MPELPEVELIRRHLAPIVCGAVVVRAEVKHERMVRRQPPGPGFASLLAGRRIESADRRGKLLLFPLDDGRIWVVHLGMSGRLSLAEPASDPHVRVVVRLRGGPDLLFVDPRTFGFTAVLTAAELHEGPAAHLGPDALEQLPSVDELVDVLADRVAPVKAVLLDQEVLAGLGNIYADEVLFRARLRPDRPAGSLARREIALLHRAVRPVLEDGLRYGGTSLTDLAYLLPDGRTGGYVRRLDAYGREGDPCRRCGAPIQRTVIRQRSAHYCPDCQR